MTSTVHEPAQEQQSQTMVARVKFPASKPVTTDNGERINIVITLPNGNDAKIWGKPGDPIASLARGQKIKVLHENNRYRFVSTLDDMLSEMDAFEKELPPPTNPGEWSIQQIITALSRKLPASLLQKKKVANDTYVDYLPWHRACQILDRYAPGWQWEIRSIHTTESQLFLVGALTIQASNGLFSREATGTHPLANTSYGDASSNAESMALRRAAAKFGLCRYLYDE